MGTNGTTCTPPMEATSNGAFQGDDPLHFALPLAILQICLVLVVTRLLAFLMIPLRQPRVIAEIIGGILLGPSALGRNQNYLDAIFPARSLTVLDTLANLGLLFFLFLAGLELDPKSIRQTGKKALGIAIVGISLPFALGIGSSFILRATISKGVSGAAFLVFMGVALSITAFAVLARILAELKLLTTDVGRLAMSAAAVNDVAAWVLLALAVALSGSGRSPLVSLWVFLSACIFVISCIILVPPIFKWLSQRCHEGEPVDEMYICATLAAVLAAGFITDTIGIHAMFGAFVIGAVVPKDGPLAGALVEKLEDLVSGLFLPLYFVSSGLKTNVATIQGLQSWGLLVLVIFTACFGKIFGTFMVSFYCEVPIREALALGFLMNTKGLVELIVLNIGKDRKVLNDQTFAIMILMAVFTTFITTPLVVAVYKPAKRARIADYMYRTIERKNPNSQLRILACFHSQRNVPSLLNLLESSRGTEKRQELCVYALHLMELSERSSAILMVHKARRNGLPCWNKGHQSDSGNIVLAFEAHQQLGRVSVRPMTAISAMSDMHEDICASAERKRTAMIILPFHRHQRWDGALETTRAEFQVVNKKVLEQAPCSVGILVDRGLGGTTYISASHVPSNVTILFFGGRDDCEALAFGMRMGEHPGIGLNVIHLLPGPAMMEEAEETVGVDIQEDDSNISFRLQDESALAELKQKILIDASFKYEVRQVENSSETIVAIKEFSGCNLFLVGRDPQGVVANGLSVKSECPELGPVGNLLTSADFSNTASVLVVQRHRGHTFSSSESQGSVSSEVEVKPDPDEDLEVN